MRETRLLKRVENKTSLSSLKQGFYTGRPRQEVKNTLDSAHSLWYSESNGSVERRGGRGNFSPIGRRRNLKGMTLRGDYLPEKRGERKVPRTTPGLSIGKGALTRQQYPRKGGGTEECRLDGGEKGGVIQRAVNTPTNNFPWFTASIGKNDGGIRKLNHLSSAASVGDGGNQGTNRKKHAKPKHGGKKKRSKKTSTQL